MMKGKRTWWGPAVIGLAAGLGLLLHSAGWILQAQGLGTSRSVRALEVTPKGILLAGTFGSGAYLSRDQGTNWKKISEGLDDPYILTLLAVSETEYFAGTARKGVFRTVDGGETWKEVNSGLGRREVKALLFEKGTLYAGTGLGVYSSPNHGDKWEPFNTGLDRTLVGALVMDAQGNLFAGTAGKGLFRRHINAPDWTQVTRGFQGAQQGILENFIRTLTVGEGSTMYAGTFDGGVYLSKDGGAEWAWWSSGMDNQSIRAVRLGPENTVYVGTGKGIFARSAGAEQWTTISEELEDDSVQSMVVDSSGFVYVGTTQGLHKGSIQGKWVMITPGFSEILFREGGGSRAAPGPAADF